MDLDKGESLSMADNENKEVVEFFQCLGEIWRDVTLIEFLLRCAIARKHGDIGKFPKPPYRQGVEYVEYPRSFSKKYKYLRDVVKEFRRVFPESAGKQEEWELLIKFRNAMAHGVIAEVGNSGTDELVHFVERKPKLKVECRFSLEIHILRGIRQSFNELRRHVMNEARDK